MSFIIYNGESFVGINDNNTLTCSANYYQAKRFAKKKAAFNTAMRQKRINGRKWVILDNSKTTLSSINIDFFNACKDLEAADFIVPVKYISDKYLNMEELDDSLLEKEKEYYLTYNKFSSCVLVNTACVIIDNFYIYLAALELGVETIPCVIEPNFYKYLEKEVQRKHDERVSIRKKVFESANGKCLMCGKELQMDNPKEIDTYMTIDHIFPKSKGGKDDVNNYQCLCQKCNRIKGDIVTPYNNLLETDLLKECI